MTFGAWASQPQNASTRAISKSPDFLFLSRSHTFPTQPIPIYDRPRIIFDCRTANDPGHDVIDDSHTHLGCGAARISATIRGMSIAVTIDDPKTLFERWFSNAIAQLEKMENADGGTAGMMIVLPLYERYIYILTATKGGKFYDNMATDLELKNASEAEIFWKTFRHGFCHTGMPLERALDRKALPKVRFSDDFSWRPELRAEFGDQLICLDPWKFIHHVMCKYEDDPTLLTKHPDAPLIAIHLFR